MRLGYRLEQLAKRTLLPWLERRVARPVLRPEEVHADGIRRILVIRQHDYLGDFLVATPVFRALRRAYPGAHIAALVSPYFADVARPHPFIDDVLVFWGRPRQWTLSRYRAFRRQLLAGWDLAIVLHTVSHSFTSDWLAYRSRARYVLGTEDFVFPGCKGNFFYHLRAPASEPRAHQSQRNLDIVRHLGIPAEDVRMVMEVLPEELESARESLARAGLDPGRPAFALHVGAGKTANRWPIPRFVELADRLRAERNAQIVLFWGPREQDLAESFTRLASHAPIAVAPGDLRRLAAHLCQCDALVCNDTGVMHLAAALDVPLVALFGPEDPSLWKPVGEAFRAVAAKDGRIASITPDEVLKALEGIADA